MEDAPSTPLAPWLAENSLPASIAEAAARAGVDSLEQLAAMSSRERVGELEGVTGGAGLKKVEAMKLKHRLESYRFAVRTAARKQAAGAAELTARALVGDGTTLAAMRGLAPPPAVRAAPPGLQPEPEQPAAQQPGPEPEPEPELEPEPEWRLEPELAQLPAEAIPPTAAPQQQPQAQPAAAAESAAQQTYDGLRERIQHLERGASPVGAEALAEPPQAGVGSVVALEGEATALCDEMDLLRQRAARAGEPLATQATRLEPRFWAFAGAALRLHAHASALHTDVEGKARRLHTAHKEKLEIEQAHREHRMHSESIEQLSLQKHAAEIRAMQVEVEEAKAALAEEASARAKEWAEASAMQEQLEAKLAQRTEQLRRLQLEFDMAGEQLEREFETQSSRLNAAETDLAETEAAFALLVRTPAPPTRLIHLSRVPSRDACLHRLPAIYPLNGHRVGR